jgi:spoIIIJ-associated protein
MGEKDNDLEREEGRPDGLPGKEQEGGPSHRSRKPFRFEEEGYWETLVETENGAEKRVAWLRKTLDEIIGLMGFKAQVEGEKREGRVFLDIKGNDSGLIIGKHGQTLDALQYIMNKIAAHRYRDLKEKVVLDTENYRGRRVAALESMALRMREKVRRSRKPVTIGPLNPQDRRVIHMALSSDEDVGTESKGEGFYKKMVIAPRAKGGG